MRRNAAGAVERGAARAQDDDVAAAAARRREGARVWRRRHMAAVVVVFSGRPSRRWGDAGVVSSVGAHRSEAGFAIRRRYRENVIMSPRQFTGNVALARQRHLSPIRKR